MYIKVGQGYNLEIPNAFTPNPDDVNDCFRILHNRISDFKIQVFNRAGQTVFQSNDPDFCWNGVWNGNPVPEGVYIYRIEARSYNGAPFDVRGTVTIFR
jgi:gliding motility-associated-like protein